MIQALIEAAVRRLRDELEELIPCPEASVLPGPVPVSVPQRLPRIVVSAGRLDIDTKARDGTSGATRPQPAEERMEIDAAARGPFRLAHAPLPGTMRAGVLLAQGTVAEHSMPLQDGSDFEVDYRDSSLLLRTNLRARLAAHASDLRARAQTLAGRAFNVDAPEELSRVLFTELRLPPPGEPPPDGYHAVTADVLEGLAGAHPIAPCVLAYWAARAARPVVLRLEYSFTGVFTVREFEQLLQVDVHGTDGAEVSMLSSLSAAILLTDQEMLRQKAAVAYATGRTVSTSLTLTHMDLSGSVPEPTDTGAHVRLSFRVAGNIKLMREPRDSIGVVERVQLAESDAPAPLSIRAEIPFRKG